MDINKSRLLLNKINRFFDNIVDDGEVSAIEKDLMLSYIRDFYESFISENTQTVAPPKPKYNAPKPPKPTYEPPKTSYEPPKPKLTPAETKPVEPQPKYPIELEIEEPKPEPKPEPIQPKPEPPKPKYVPPVAKVELPKPKPEPKYEPIQPKPEPPEPEPKYEEPTPPEPPKEPTIEDPMDYDEFDVLFEEQKVKDLSDRLSQGKITNLRAAMGINERFLMQNELFHGNNKKFNDAIEAFNSFDNFHQAKAYILKELAPNNDWLDKRRLKKAKAFILKVKRLYK